MNKVVLIGRLARDPEMRTTANGNTSTNFTLAVSRNFTNQNGERDADFINCVAWRRLAETIGKYCTKGSQIAVDGRIQTRSYDAQDGTKRYVTEVIVDNMEFVGSKNGNATMSSGNNNNFEDNNHDMGNISTADTTDLSVDPYEALGEEVALSDDDLPF